MQKITYHLWFDRQAIEAAEFYVSVFKGSAIKDKSQLKNTPSGTVDIVTAELMGQEFTLLSAGPLFKFNPSISFLVACKTKNEVDELWAKLSPGGKVLMELGEYPFSERYAWLEDRYGLSWQLMFMGEREVTQNIIPTLMFVGDMSGKAEEAIGLYATIFHDAEVGDILRYDPGDGPEVPGTIKHANFTLEGQAFAAMDSARMHDFKFNEAISFMVHCADQDEIDYHWDRLSAVPESEQCGWLKDKYGVSWQIVPEVLDVMMQSKDEKKIARVTEAFLKMKKFDLKELQKAYDAD
ncbi:MAG: VOC family protein [Patescibacteria group bacterium]|nr:VOC family protein [Patescibacteria group bacterium]